MNYETAFHVPPFRKTLSEQLKQFFQISLKRPRNAPRNGKTSPVHFPKEAITLRNRQFAAKIIFTPDKVFRFDQLPLNNDHQST